MSDLSVDNITEHTVQVNSQCPDPRTRYIFERLVTHLHDFARETRLSTAEWTNAVEFLTQTGQKCSDIRQEFILLSDILGLSSLVDSIDHPKPQGATQGTLLGPFHTHDAETLESGVELSHDTAGKKLFVLCTARDTNGKPVADARVDVWEADSSGLYDVQYTKRERPDNRGVLHTNSQGQFWFTAIQPVPYPIPDDGPVGKLLATLGRHQWRPAHMHFIVAKAGFDTLVTTLYPRGDPYEKSDAVFGVKSSLVIDYGSVDEEMAKKYGVPAGTALMSHDFVLATEQEAKEERDRNSVDALKKLGRNVKIVDGLPVPDVD
ncbi:hydroxyquinol 1,2-dioxygenase [Nannizzia gypsea CBS 118893]|uniref:Hydroxyquinol 1,2-dioxygenase n=1 Tax=Arthroderma gypseum (strain ATCC MYA-4604 / CBS 118893) TaxID=535722 RepID=E4V214_ARTGP|nr:hydroxyquinol 1,2-dioxygenase [Nannizzia gypsea CBS 118893]EFR04079.1 hydroxyquinol 1,2-dioxygenase [Nannizzia gypsea CBS 118893]